MLTFWLGAASVVSTGQSLPAARAAEQEAEPIIITGERVARGQSETASSVVVLTEDDIEAHAGTDRLEQLLALVPNVEPGGGNDGPTIRGQDTTGILREVQAFLGGTRPRVTVQIDGRNTGYFESNFGTTPIWDVAQVEIFRSPQTTTQGRNSIGGGIFVRTNLPTYDWEGRARLNVGNYQTRQASVLLSGPIIADQMAFRAAADFRRERVSSRMTDLIPDANLNRDEYGILRFRLLTEPKALSGVRLVTTYVHQESRSPQIVGVQRPFEARRAEPFQFYGVFDTNVESLTTSLDFELSPALGLTNTFSWGDSLARRRARVGLGQARIKVHDFSIEPVIRWRPLGSANLVTGLNYQRSRLNQYLDITNFAPVFGIAEFVDDQSSLGLFGELDLERGPWRIATGLRYQRDSQDREGSIRTVRPGYVLNYDESFQAWLPKVSVAYEISDAFNLGFLVQRAYNPGGVTLTIDRGTVDSFDEETLWNYEIFGRAVLAGGDLVVASNLFYSDIRDAQRPQVRFLLQPNGQEAPITEIDNAPKAEAYGAELEVSWRVDRSLTLRTGLGLLRTQITRTVDPRDALLGKEFQRSPRLSAVATIDWRPFRGARLSAQLRRHDGYFSNDANSPALRIGGTTVVDGRASYEAGSITFSAYVRNAFDAFYLTLLTASTLGRAGDPREWGFGIEGRF